MTLRFLVLHAAFFLASPLPAQQPPDRKKDEPPPKRDAAPAKGPKDVREPQPEPKQPAKDRIPDKDPKTPAKDEKAPKLPTDAVTDGSVIIAGQKVEYKATAGVLPSTDKTGKAKANIFYKNSPGPLNHGLSPEKQAIPEFAPTGQKRV